MMEWQLIKESNSATRLYKPDRCKTLQLVSRSQSNGQSDLKRNALRFRSSTATQRSDENYSAVRRNDMFASTKLNTCPVFDSLIKMNTLMIIMNDTNECVYEHNEEREEIYEECEAPVPEYYISEYILIGGAERCLLVWQH